MSDDQNETKKEMDDVTGVETTGHEWDGLKELNNPLPRWWVWVWLVTIIWAAWYCVVYPSWPVPGGATEGLSGYTQQGELEKSQAEIMARQAVYLERFEQASLEEVLDDPELYAFAVAGGSSAFKDNCATCHGSGATGSKGYPNLNDDDWLWGGKLGEIHETIQYGIRADNLDTRTSQMPAFGQEELLEREEVDAVVDYVLTLSGAEKAATHVQGEDVYMMQCASCHGEQGEGGRDFGAPNLADKIWLYGGDREAVYETVYYAKAGLMPAWGERLDENTTKQLAIYVHQLGGGDSEGIASQEEAPLVVPVAEDLPAALEELVPDVEMPEMPDVQELRDAVKDVLSEDHVPAVQE